MPPPPSEAPPWHQPAALKILRARALTPTREAWLELVAATITEAGTRIGAARALGLSHRTFERWLAWLRDHDAAGYATLPEAQPGGHRPRREPEPAPE